MRARLLFAVAIACLVAAISCDERGSAGPSPPASAAVLSPVPAPSSLLAEVIVPRPDAVWARARATLGGPATLLPASIGGLAATLFGMPITAATEIDGATPALGAIADAGQGQTPHAVLGLHVRDAAHLLVILTGGDVARFSSRIDQGSGVTLLEPRGTKGPAAMGVLGNWLLIAPTEKALLEVGPFVARTLPARPPPRSDASIEVPPSAFAGPLKERLTILSKQLDRPDAPATLLGPLTTLIAVLGDLGSATITLDWDEAALHLRATAVPANGSGAAAAAVKDLASGNPGPLLALPGETSLGVLFHESAASRASSAAKQADAVSKLLGTALGEADAKKLTDRLSALAAARGDWVALGLRFDETGPAGYARAAVADPDAMGKGLKGLVAFAKDGPLRAAMKDAGIVLKADKIRIDGLGDVQRIRFERPKNEKDAPPGLPPSVDLLYSVGKDAVLLAAGLDAKDAMADLASAPSGDSLGSKVPAVKTALEALGGEVVLAIVFEPLKLVASRAGKPAAGQSAPVIVGFGTKKDPAPGAFFANADLANVALRELFENKGAFFDSRPASR